MAKIKSKNVAARWQESIRALLDIKHVGLVLAVGAENLQECQTLVC